MPDEALAKLALDWAKRFGVRLPSPISPPYQWGIGRRKRGDCAYETMIVSLFSYQSICLPDNSKADVSIGVFDVEMYKDGTLRSLSNWEAFHRLADRSSPERLPDKVEPSMSNEEVLNKALLLRKEILGDKEARFTFSEPEITFYPYSDLRGTWQVEWRRTFGGYEMNDCVRISFYVTGDVEVCQAWLDSEPCPLDVKITEAQAREIAEKFADKTMKHGGFYGATYEGIHECALRIVNLRPVSDDHGDLALVSPKTRLAFCVMFKLRFPGGDVAKDIFGVDIDAQTGEILGSRQPA